MHDLHVADKIVKLVKEYAKKNNLSSIRNVNINLGSIIEHGDEINSENLKFNIKNLTLKDLMFKNTKIIITKVKSDTWELESIEG